MQRRHVIPNNSTLSNTLGDQTYSKTHSKNNSNRRFYQKSISIIFKSFTYLCIFVCSIVLFQLYTNRPTLYYGPYDQYHHHHTLQMMSMSMSPETKYATEQMMQQPSSWVNGEKKLKKRLQVLRQRQMSGVDVGVDHLTRWMGKNVPVWKPKDGNEVLEFDDDVEEQEEMSTYLRVASKAEGNKDPKDLSVGRGEKSVAQEKTDDEDDDDYDNKGLENNGDVEIHTGKKQDSTFPSPASKLGENASILLQPSFGSHRPDVDAVFALAEGYDLSIYKLFLESLKATGFDGDVVLSISSTGNMKTGVEDYLKEQENIVLYMMDWNCVNKKGESQSGAGEGIHLCQAHGLYTTSSLPSSAAHTNDPRDPRPVATARYELYWMWSTHYNDSSVIMLIDSRDSYFQSNPFISIERSEQDTLHSQGGLLHFFAENAEAVTLGSSSYNLRWLTQAYGTENVQKYLTSPVICSGSTMGEKLALETYLRAMVAQFDTTKCILKGCDQGFHNYLYYSHALEGLSSIRKVIVYEQGTGLINNLAALRNKSLREQNVLDSEMHVLNWDGSISAVAHQVDRDKELNAFMKEKKKSFQ